MDLERITEPLTWPLRGTSDMQELCHDWFGDSFGPPAQYRLVEDPTHLWLVAGREMPAKPHSMGDCGDFQPELWQHDVAEMFIADPDFKNYLEFNLSPRGAWWAARFSEPRQEDPLEALPEVLTHALEDDQGHWVATLGVPLEWLRQTIAWGPDSPLNVTFILDSPNQRFLSACDLGAGEPDYHRPQGFRVPSPRP